MIELSSDQKQCLDAIMSWCVTGNSTNRFVMGGLAGTGKTTLIKYFRDLMNQMYRVAFCALTGKAASVLRRKLGHISEMDYCGTIHSLIYDPVFDEITHEIKDWILKSYINYNLIVIDEASMLSEELLADLSSYGIKILCIGDHGQLPPIKGELNLMENPDIKLEKIHRMCESNPIIQLSQKVRNGEKIPNGSYGDRVHKVDKNDPLEIQFLHDVAQDAMNNVILCAFNRDRVKFNLFLREVLERSTMFPLIGDRVICLRNNRHANVPVYNGVLGTVHSCNTYSNSLNMEIWIDGFDVVKYRGAVTRKIFEDPECKDRGGSITINGRRVPLDCFDYGYCITVHKSQGSEWPNVMVQEQTCSKWEHSRWLYTAITRSSDRLLWVAQGKEWS